MRDLYSSHGVDGHPRWLVSCNVTGVLVRGYGGKGGLLDKGISESGHLDCPRCVTWLRLPFLDRLSGS